MTNSAVTGVGSGGGIGDVSLDPGQHPGVSALRRAAPMTFRIRFACCREPHVTPVADVPLWTDGGVLVELVEKDLFGDEADAEFAGGGGFA
jgi:hypothetical protein